MSSNQFRGDTSRQGEPEDIPFACNMLALIPEERPQHEATIKRMQQAIEEIKELPDGYAFRFLASRQNLLLLSQFIAGERLCCPFFTFELLAEQGDGPLWLSLRGRNGIKDFIIAELNIEP